MRGSLPNPTNSGAIAPHSKKELVIESAIIVRDPSSIYFSSDRAARTRAYINMVARVCTIDEIRLAA